MKRHLIAVISAVISVGIYAGSLQAEVTRTPQRHEIVDSNILTRVLPIKVGARTGTAFTIEVDGKQYLITAKHITGNQEIETVEIWRNRWITAKVKTVGIGKGKEDIVVLAANTKLTENLDIEVGSGPITLGQDVRFLGFPLGIKVEYMTQTGGIILPLVKGGILSAIKSEEGTSWLLVDGHNNEGFSGGPVIFKPLKRKIERWKIAAVISGYQVENTTVMDKTGKIIGYAAGNSGILVATGIKTAVDLIKSNPIGYPVEEK